jgi:hypothetical protein
VIFLRKTLIKLIFLLTAVFNNYSQELGLQLDFGEIIDMSFGAGIDFTINNTSIETAAGYGFGRMHWYNFGEDYYIAPDNSDISNSLFYNMLYFRTELKQNLFGDDKPYHMDIRLNHVTGFYLPAQNPDKDIYQQDLVYGDNNSNHSESGLSYLFYMKDDNFWTSFGFEYYSNLNIEYGSEYNSSNWSFLSTYHKVETWLPIAGQYLFFHLKGAGEFIPAVFNGEVPIYAYPHMRIRHVDKYFYNFSTLYSKFELISRFIKFRILCDMSLGVGAFFDMGIAGEDFSDYNADNFVMSFGGFLEYKIKVVKPLYFPLTFHFGIKNQIDENEIKPGFLFEIKL